MSSMSRPASIVPVWTMLVVSVIGVVAMITTVESYQSPVWTSANQVSQSNWNSNTVNTANNVNNQNKPSFYYSSRKRQPKPAIECALILRRVKQSENVSHRMPASFKALIESLRGNSVVSRANSYAELCITFDDVNRAVREAMYNLDFRRPTNIDTLEPPPDQIATTGELTQQITKILASRFTLSHDEILNALPLIDMSRTILWPHCPAHVKPMQCKLQRYRTFTAHCNNLENPSWGASNTPFVRYLPPVYSDGIDGLRESVIPGQKLPHPRLVIRTVHRDIDRPDNDMTIMFMSWGQFIDHDLALAMPPRLFRNNNEIEVDCCKPSLEHPLCMPFNIPPNDPVYGPRGKQCHDFKRSVAGQRPNCALGPRVHVNILTAPIDANFVYGSTEAVARSLRSFEKGYLKVWHRFDAQSGMKPLLPAQHDSPDLECTRRPRSMFCFLAGDIRVNEQIHLTVLHTIYVRDHNRIANELGKLNPHWDDERLYQESRHIMAAITQHITVTEWLPALIGHQDMDLYNLTESDGYWHGYDPSAHTSPSQAFTTAAFRVGHTFIQGRVNRYDPEHRMMGSHSLRELLRHPFILYEPGMVDQFLLGLVNTPAQRPDSFITKEVAGHLFQQPDDYVGLDLPSINLMRAREQGVPGYNFYREWCGLGRALTFEDLVPMVGNASAYLYSTLYAHVDDIDLWSGGVSEVPLPNALVGPTFACIIGRNFANIKKGDRFWFENGGMLSSFTPGQLRQIKRTSQAKLLCDNADNIRTIQRDVLTQAHPTRNPRVDCRDIDGIDFRYFRENPNTGEFEFEHTFDVVEMNSVGQNNNDINTNNNNNQRARY